jgi:methylthioribose-1-phosphate isomerase
MDLKLNFKTIEWISAGSTGKNKVRILDQTELPEKTLYKDFRTFQDIAKAIKTMQIRGAPAIGIGAAYGVALGMQNEIFKNKNECKKRLDYVIQALQKTRPTAVNLFWASERMRNLAERNLNQPLVKINRLLVKEAKKIHEEDMSMCKRIGEYGAKLLKKGDTVLTHCNAGALATGGIGTALAVIYTAVGQGKKIKVFVDETRPILQGARLTCWELKQQKIEHTLICDDMAAYVMKKGLVNCVIVGADRIARNRDVANKIGTYNLAILAQYHKIPFYVAAPSSTFDNSIKSGREIKIEQRKPEEITHWGDRIIAPTNIKVLSPAFDVTPANLITAIITDKGIIKGKKKSWLK